MLGILDQAVDPEVVPIHLRDTLHRILDVLAKATDEVTAESRKAESRWRRGRWRAGATSHGTGLAVRS